MRAQDDEPTNEEDDDKLEKSELAARTVAKAALAASARPRA